MREDRISFPDAARPPAGVLCCGNLVLDILVRPVAGVAWGATTWVETVQQSVGGNGANTSYALATLGNPVRLVADAGADEFGDRVLRKLESAGVDLSFVVRSGLPTARSVVLVHPDGARALLHQPGASREAFAAGFEFKANLIAGCDRFHFANIFALPALQPLAAETLREARQAGLRTSLDTGWDAAGGWMKRLAPCLPEVDLLFVNEDEAHRLTGNADPEAAVRIFREHGATAVVVKLGERGCAVFTESDSFCSPAFSVPVADTTGAGDCFVGGFLAALERGYGYRDAACFANAVGALSVGHLGGVAGLLTFSETVRWLEHQTS